ncbi:phosphatase PAP2 family protein [Pelagibacterium luteolum]|uniref:Undecaprenyl-diphosphatase n=1 Tax=Pelagibacterium luteolum TaxID=440168 RepID=A0A1G7TDN3_9HYPH|nr:phosphatase PAP2 family protein [Pelagibacterium luteolum]SDG33426.1 undecaprenyl-diphosphatase [Pelagibacterium luteolum]
MFRTALKKVDVDQVRRFITAEYLMLLAVGLSSLLIFFFIDIADDVMEGDTLEADMAIMNLFRVPGDPTQVIGPPYLHEAVRDITALGSGTILALIVTIVVAVLLMVNERRGAILIVVSTISGAILSNTLKLGFSRQRPEFDTFYAEMTNSFPSGHAMLTAVTFLTLGALLARIVDSWRLRVFFFAVAIILTLGVGVSRVFLGVHYPSDVVAGWALGSAWALAWSAIAAFLQRRGII